MSNRIRFLIEPRTQMKLVLLTVLVNILGLITFAVALKTYFGRFISAATDKGLPKDHLFFQYIELQETAMWQIFGSVAFISTIVTILVALIYSHRFVGPLHRLKEHLLQYEQTKTWQALTFRKNDYLNEIGDLLNKLVGKGS